MRRLPPNASDDDILATVREWVGLLVEERYDEAFAFLFPPTPQPSQRASNTVTVEHWTPDLIATIIHNYGLIEPWGDEVWRVTPLDEACGGPSPIHEVTRFDPGEAAKGLVGIVWFDLPLNGAWSDLTATFDLDTDGQHLLLTLDDIHVM